ncbi:TRIM55 [Mytilus coruscus]|uniref:TRIM55 n=1 Tax=Mytilus coruscus TaxID=42192 RepID=A0A6J8DVL9_MYTCO|nr:TRIM55 [Mytilus coruscus]
MKRIRLLLRQEHVVEHVEVEDEQTSAYSEIILDRHGSFGLQQDDCEDGIYKILDELICQTDFDPRIVDHLISSCVLTIDDGEDIMQASTRIRKNKILFDILFERPFVSLIPLKQASIDVKNIEIQTILERNGFIDQEMNLPTVQQSVMSDGR